MHGEHAALGDEVEPVVGDEPRPQPARFPRFDQAQRQQRFARPRGTAQHDAGAAEDEPGGVDVLAFTHLRCFSAGALGASL
jgi:hypothetical protein